MFTKIWFFIILFVFILFLARVSLLSYKLLAQNDFRNDANSKADITYSWQEIFQNKPILTLLGKCEAPDGKGGIDLDAYNPKDIDGKEKFGPLQFDKDTFYEQAAVYKLFKTPDISNPVQQILLAEHMIADGKWFKWGCWVNTLFPR